LMEDPERSSSTLNTGQTSHPDQSVRALDPAKSDLTS
jgi:hypothetical protein